MHVQDVFEDDTAVHLVMELCEGGSVLDGLKDGEYSERQVQGGGGAGWQGLGSSLGVGRGWGWCSSCGALMAAQELCRIRRLPGLGLWGFR